MKSVVTGAAGFIGSHVTEKLLERGDTVIAIDNLSSGKRELIEELKKKGNLTFVETDLLVDEIDHYFEDMAEVYHFAANPDVRLGNQDTRVHLNQNVIVTYRVLEACRKAGVGKFIFTSSSTVYGETDVIPTPENSRLEPISFYGASKLASESLISSYAHNSSMKACVFRLANVIGERSNHGVIFDFINKLSDNPQKLEILGDGTQNKSYIYIDDCINAILFAVEKINETFQTFNVGSQDQISVKNIAEIVSEEMGLQPKFLYTGGNRGWKGDVPKMMLDIAKIKSIGWEPKLSSVEAVRKTVKGIVRG